MKVFGMLTQALRKDRIPHIQALCGFGILPIRKAYVGIFNDATSIQDQFYPLDIIIIYMRDLHMKSEHTLPEIDGNEYR